MSSDNCQTTTSGYIDNSVDYSAKSSSETKQPTYDAQQTNAKSCFNQENETPSNCNIHSRRSPESSQTPVSSPITNSSTISSSSQMDDVFMPSSPPKASSSPISFRNDLSKQSVRSTENKNNIFETSNNVRESSVKDSDRPDYIALRSPKSSSIQGSVTIRALNESNKSEVESENLEIDNISVKTDSKELRYDSNDKSEDFVSIRWSEQDSKDDESDSEHQRQYKKGDTPTEVFKVAALYVT